MPAMLKLGVIRLIRSLATPQYLLENWTQEIANPVHGRFGINLSEEWAIMSFSPIKTVRTFVTPSGAGGDYHDQKSGHWIIDHGFSTPMSDYPEFDKTRTSFGINVLGAFVVELETEDGTKGVATGFGGPPACWLVEKHFARFVIGQDPRNTNKIWDQMWSASMFYGRKGLPVAVLSVVDLAIWDLLGKIRKEPVYKMIGGAVRDQVEFYATGPDALAIKKMGFRAAKVPLPHGPAVKDSLKKNVAFLKRHKDQIGTDFPLRVDCWMSLNVRYAIDLATACKKSGVEIDWFEEVLHPDDVEGYSLIRQAHPDIKWTTGEHEYSRYGFRRLVEGRFIDILQPDVMWCGGLTELLRISALASAYDIPIVPHGSGPYTAHFCITQKNSPYSEYIANSPDGTSVHPCFGNLFKGEVLPIQGAISIDALAGHGFGLTLDYDNVIPFTSQQISS